jgi:hypothetical protein
MGLIPNWSKDISMRLSPVSAVLCVGIGPATGWSHVQGVQLIVYWITKSEESGHCPTKCCGAIDEWINEYFQGSRSSVYVQIICPKLVDYDHHIS